MVGMRIIATVAAMQKLALRWKRTGTRVGLVPTMGYLHAGHLSLVKRARQAVGKNGVVVVSIYVNPTQFGPKEDFSKYPRDLKRDLKLCREAGVDVVFTPSDKEMYSRWGEATDEPARGDARPTNFSTYVVEEKLSQTMEGASRPDAFSRRDDGGGQVVQPRAAGRGGVRREGLAAGGHHQTHGGGFEFPGENHRRADAARSATGWR